MKRIISLFIAVLVVVTFARAEEFTPSATPLNIGENNVQIKFDDFDTEDPDEFEDYRNYTLFQYTVQADCYLTIYADGSLDTFGVLFDEDLNYLKQSDDDYDDYNFSFSFNAKAGKVFYIGALYYSDDSVVADCKIVVEEKTNVVATIDGKKYYDFSNAINTISDDETLKLFTDIEFSDGDDHEISLNSITLDLNGHTIYGRIRNTAYLTIDDSSEGKSGRVETTSNECLLINENENCDMTINGGTFVGEVITSSTGSYSFYGGTFILPDNSTDGYAIYPGEDTTIGEGIVYRDLSGLHDDISEITETITYSGQFVPANSPSGNAPIIEITAGGDTRQFNNLSDYRTVIFYIQGTASVKLLSDITLEEESNFYFGNDGTDITLDLNGHNIIGSNDDSSIISAGKGKLTIIGEGTVENRGEFGFAIHSEAQLIVKGGTYKGTTGVCFIFAGGELIIDDGKFDAPYMTLIINEEMQNKPTIKGGLFSMDPKDCVAEGYKVVNNDDAVYKYKVVAKGATGIEAIEVEKMQKAVKTIENGRVVIIRDGVRYDISGRRL